MIDHVMARLRSTARAMGPPGGGRNRGATPSAAHAQPCPVPNGQSQASWVISRRSTRSGVGGVFVAVPEHLPFAGGPSRSGSGRQRREPMGVRGELTAPMSSSAGLGHVVVRSGYERLIRSASRKPSRDRRARRRPIGRFSARWRTYDSRAVTRVWRQGTNASAVPVPLSEPDVTARWVGLPGPRSLRVPDQTVVASQPISSSACGPSLRRFLPNSSFMRMWKPVRLTLAIRTPGVWGP